MNSLARLWDSDVAYSFRTSPVAVAAFAVAFVLIFSAVFAEWVAPHNPFDLATINLLDASKPPAWSAEGEARFFFGTDDQGRDVYSAILYGMRISLAIGVASVILSVVLGVALGLLSGYVGGRLDAFIMRVCDVMLSFPAILVALLIDGVFRAALPREAHDEVAFFVLILAIALSGWVQYARTVRGSTLVEKNKEYVQAARVIGVSPLAIMGRHVARSGAGPGHRAHRHCDHHRGDAQLSRRRGAADHAVARYADPHRQRVPLLGRMVDHHLPGCGACPARPVRQPAWRLAARCAQSEAAMSRRDDTRQDS